MSSESIEEYRKRFHIFLSSVYKLKYMMLAYDLNPWEFQEFHYSPSEEVNDFQRLAELISKNYSETGFLCLPADASPSIIHYAIELSMLHVGLVEYREPGDYLNFSEVIKSQSLVMIIAYLEAFLIDSVRALCKTKPEVMKGRRSEIEWRSIIDGGTFEEVIELLVGIYSKDFESKNIGQYVKLMRNRFKLNIKFPEEGIKLLDKARYLRHIVVHNGGRSNKRYLSRTKRTDISEGQQIQIERNWLGDVWESANGLATRIFIDVGEKFFDTDAEKLIYWNNEDLLNWNGSKVHYP